MSFGPATISKYAASSAMIKPSSHSGVTLAALFMLWKGFVLSFAGAGLLGLLDAEIATFLAPVLDVFHLQIHTRLIHSFLLKLTALSPHHLVLMAELSLLYAAWLCVEGFGLWVEAPWAAYMTVISTSLFLPVEFHDLIRHLTALRVAVFLLNVAIVIYLVARLGGERSSTRENFFPG
jgi:uncharacterized membrane protein (DUF2068 family)